MMQMNLYKVQMMMMQVQMMQMNLFLWYRNRDMDTENTHMDAGHGHREQTYGCRRGRTNWEIRTDIYTLPCVKQLVESLYTAQGAQLSALC